MTIFADTSALLPLLVQDDSLHFRARASFEYFAQEKRHLPTSSCVLIEIGALLQRRIGLEAAWDFKRKILPFRSRRRYV